MKVLLTGGGTGGHITPILAVAHELKEINPECITIYVGERGSKFTALTAGHPAIDEVYIVSAGKFRRYYGESWLRRLIDVKTNLLNLRDGFRVLVGTFQAWRVLRKIKPDVVFLKGGFVGVPVGLAAAFLHVPIITHDSDALPGLANRLVSRWVRIHATALPKKYYPYPAHKIRPVGVLVERSYNYVDTASQHAFRQQLGMPADALIVLVTGGSLGAVRLNKAMVKITEELLTSNPKLYIIHQAGKGKSAVYGSYRHDRLKVLETLSPMHAYMGAADLVITRAGGNTLAELGVQAKACIIVPNPDLTGGHQLKNADLLAEQGTAIVVLESELYDNEKGLLPVTQRLLADEDLRKELARKLHQLTIPDAAHRLALLLLEDKK